MKILGEYNTLSAKSRRILWGLDTKLKALFSYCDTILHAQEEGQRKKEEKDSYIGAK